MSTASVQVTITAEIAAFTGIDCSGCEWEIVTGGDINKAWKLIDQDGRAWFLKLNKPVFAEYFAAESAGLLELNRAPGICVPEPAGHGVTETHAWLLLEWLEMSSPDVAADERFGRALAEMHRITAEQFGWHRDNVIGATPQSNNWSDDWAAFYSKERLAPQLSLAGHKGAPSSLLNAGSQLLDKVDTFFTAYTPVPSLLHGDLWGGNRSMLTDGTPVLFDPAVYFGDRESDLAMTHLFGGFGKAFYAAYEAAWPLEENHDARQTLYKLYHVLNHFNLFGSSYLGQAEKMIQKLLAK
jgi:protein-ribulosamine 3-kinase